MLWSECRGKSCQAIVVGIYDEVWHDYVPDGLCTQIFNLLAEDAAHFNVTPDVNIVEKVLCVVSEYEGVVTFLEVNAEYDTSERRAIATVEVGLNGELL